MRRIFVVLAALVICTGLFAQSGSSWTPQGLSKANTGITPNGSVPPTFRLPAFTTALLPALTVGQPGSPVWDSTVGAMKVWNGTAWGQPGDGYFLPLAGGTMTGALKRASGLSVYVPFTAAPVLSLTGGGGAGYPYVIEYLVVPIDSAGRVGPTSNTYQALINSSYYNFTIQLSWTLVSGATSYKIYRSVFDPAIGLSGMTGYVTTVAGSSWTENWASGDEILDYGIFGLSLTTPTQTIRLLPPLGAPADTREIYFPDASGTVALTSDIPTTPTLAQVTAAGAITTTAFGTSATSGDETISATLSDQGYFLSGHAYATTPASDRYAIFRPEGVTLQQGLFPAKSGHLDATTLTADRDWVMPNQSGTVAMTSDLSAYLPLAGGTMTGAITFPGTFDISGYSGGLGKELRFKYGGSIYATLTDTGGFSVVGSLSGSTLSSTAVSPIAPMSINSDVLVSNLNADLLDDLHSSSFALLDGGNGWSGTQTLGGGAGKYVHIYPTTPKIEVENLVGRSTLGVSTLVFGDLTFTGTFAAPTFAGNYTWTLPAKSGTVAMTSDLPATPTLAAVTAAGNTTTDAISTGSITVTGTGQPKVQVADTSVTVTDSASNGNYGALGQSLLAFRVAGSSGRTITLQPPASIASASKVVSMQDKDGTVALLGDISTAYVPLDGTVPMTGPIQLAVLTSQPTGTVQAGSMWYYNPGTVSNYFWGKAYTGVGDFENFITDTNFDQYFSDLLGRTPVDAATLQSHSASYFQQAGSYLTAEADTLATVTGRGATTPTTMMVETTTLGVVSRTEIAPNDFYMVNQVDANNNTYFDLTPTSFQWGKTVAGVNHYGSLNPPVSLSNDPEWSLPNASGTVPLLETANTWTAAQTVNLGAQAAAAPPADAVALINTTASTAVATIQNSPSLRMECHGWDTDGSNDKWEWRQYLVPTSAATTISLWKLGVSKNGAAETFPLIVKSNGQVVVGGELVFASTGASPSMYGLNYDNSRLAFGTGTSYQSGMYLKAGVFSWVLSAYANAGKNHDHGAQSNPTLFVHSATDPDTDNTQWLSLTHDGTNGVIGVGSGVLNLPALGTTTASQYRLSALNTAPANATDTGVLGEIRIVADYIYICTATNTWVRAALATW